MTNYKIMFTLLFLLNAISIDNNSYNIANKTKDIICKKEASFDNCKNKYQEIPALESLSKPVKKLPIPIKVIPYNPKT